MEQSKLINMYEEAMEGIIERLREAAEQIPPKMAAGKHPREFQKFGRILDEFKSSKIWLERMGINSQPYEQEVESILAPYIERVKQLESLTGGIS